MKNQQVSIAAPWHLVFDRDGTEDFAVIRDAEGYDIVRSEYFWLPEAGDPPSPTLAAVKMMAAAPELYDALALLLEQTVEMDLKYGIRLSEGERLARAKALKAMKKARAA